jgi:protocatechuate 3,4-dioxygenase beta subunit
VIVKRTGATTCSVTTCVSTRAAYEPQVWWTGAWAYGTVRLGVAPSSGTVVSDDAEVLDSMSLKALRQVSDDMTTLTFAAETAQIGQLKPGDVLLTAPSATFPDGICRKVVSVADQGGKPVVTTAQAALTDVIDQGEVAFSQRISGADLSQEYVTQPGVRLSREPRPSGPLPWPSWAASDDGFGFTLATKVFDPVTGLALAEVKGSVWLSAEAYVDIDLKPWGVESASYTQDLSTTTDLTVSLMASGKKEAKRVIYQQTMGVITIMIGPAPVFVTPVFTVYVGAKGELSAGVTGGVSMTSDISVGISYEDDRDEHWAKTWSFEKTITWSPPQVFGKVTLRGFAGVGLAFKFYGVAGPEAQLEPYLQLDANTLADPWWTLKAGVDAKLGFKVEVLGATIMEHSATFPVFWEPLDQAGSGGDPGDGAYQLPSIRGAVLDAGSSAPVSGATVEVRSGAPPGGSAVFTTYAAADGGYVFFGLMPGQYTVAAWDEGYADNNRAVTVVAGSTTEGQDVRLTADENQGVKGRVVTFPGGGPLSGADVELRVGGIPAWCSPEGSIDSAADGSFEFLGLEPGPYWLTADKEGYFGDRIELTVLAGRLTRGQDIRMVPYASQGLTGTVISSLNGQPIAGATMHLHYGADSPASDWTKATTTAVDGSYAFTGVSVTDSGGLYTVTAAKTGYVDGARNSTVASARVTTGQDLQLAPVGLDGAARSVEEDDFIRYDAGAALADGWGDPLTGMTYEFWFKAATGFPGHIAMVTYRYGNWPDDWINNHCVVDLALMAEGGNIVFGINENDGGGPGDGTWHYLVSDTVPEPGRWYHIAAQCGTKGMKLFIDGRREAADPYAGIPEVDRADGTLTGGWFTLGDYDNAHGGPASLSALGAYRQLRVSYVQRYTEDFTPPDMAVADDDTALLDHLVGGTVGDNYGFVWVP